MKNKIKKEEYYQITVFGILTCFVGLTEEMADKVLDTLELVCRRREEGQPALILNGRDSELVGVKYVKKRKQRKIK